MPTTIIRLAPSDPARLRAVRLRALRDAPYAFAASYEESAARPLQAWSKQLSNLATFVAVRDGADVGLIRSGADARDHSAAELLSLWVAPEARGQGVGEALIDAVAGWARAEGFARLSLAVVEHNAPAIALYVRKGFVQTTDACAEAPNETHVREIRMTLEL